MLAITDTNKVCWDEFCVATTGACWPNVPTFGCRGDMSPTCWRLSQPSTSGERDLPDQPGRTEHLPASCRHCSLGCSTSRASAQVDIELLYALYKLMYANPLGLLEHMGKVVLLLLGCVVWKHTSEVQSKMIVMGHQISSCNVPVVRSFFIL